MVILGLIPARGGSKGIPRKNLAPCGGQPLIAHTCAAALGSQKLERVIVSTDDPEIAAIAAAWGVEVPFLRPPDLAQDQTPMLAVLQHALNWGLETGLVVEALVLLQPTSPLRQSWQIDQAIALFQERQAATVVSVVPVPHQFNPVSVLRLEADQVFPFLPNQPLITRRQDKPVVYARNGPAILVVRPEVIQQGLLYGDPTLGYIMDARTSLDVDALEDLQLVEVLLQRPLQDF